MPKEELLEGRLPADGVGVGRVAETALANPFRGLHKGVVEEQDRFDLVRKVDIRQDLGVAARHLREEGAVEVEKAAQDLVVLGPEGGVAEGRDPALDLPAGQTLRIAGECETRLVRMHRAQDTQVQRLVEKAPVDIAHVGLKEAVLTAVGQVGMARIGRRGRAQLLHREDNEVVVQHADARHARRGQRPGGIQTRLPGHHQCLARIRIAPKHLLDDDPIHPVPDALHRRRDLGAANRTAERVEDAFGGVVDDRAIQLGGMPQRLTVEQQILLVAQQTVVLH